MLDRAHADSRQGFPEADCVVVALCVCEIWGLESCVWESTYSCTEDDRLGTTRHSLYDYLVKVVFFTKVLIIATFYNVVLGDSLLLLHTRLNLWLHRNDLEKNI
jgi:hypothetical protein